MDSLKQRIIFILNWFIKCIAFHCKKLKYHCEGVVGRMQAFVVVPLQGTGAATARCEYPFHLFYACLKPHNQKLINMSVSGVGGDGFSYFYLRFKGMKHKCEHWKCYFCLSALVFYIMCYFCTSKLTSLGPGAVSLVRIGPLTIHVCQVWRQLWWLDKATVACRKRLELPGWWWWGVVTVYIYNNSAIQSY